MEDVVKYRIIETVESNREYIPKGYVYFQMHINENGDSLSEYILGLFNVLSIEEEAIKEERQAAYVTNDYENGVRNFAIALLKVLLENHEVLNGMMPYAYLLGQKHMAYAFYHLLDIGSIDLHLQEDKRYRNYLYQGLVNFYSAFYGNFSDNEEAVRLLCKYYPKGEDVEVSREEVICALMDHIKNAGAFNDLGYAFRGIEQIQKYICGLPDDFIQKLLEQYALYDVVNQKVYRHQMFAIIDGSELGEEDKHILKFFYLDSLLLANLFNTEWVNKVQEDGNEVEVYYNSYDEKLNVKRINVLKEPEAYWDNMNKGRRLFYVDGQQMAEVVKKEDGICFWVQEHRKDFPYQYNDWALEDFQSEEVREEIRYLLSGSESESQNQMVYSMLYLDNYRGVKNQILDFDHRYLFHPNSGELKFNNKGSMPGLHFYGKAVYSLSCIVGKNGTGKSSIVDFLRDIFYKMIRVLEDFDVLCDNGYVSIDDFLDYGILDGERNFKFLVVFRVGEDDYFLTNMDDLKAVDVPPYQKGVCRNLQLCKVVYFSQQMRTDQIVLFESGNRTQRQEVRGVAGALKGLGQWDYSEMKSYVQKKNAIMVLEGKEITPEAAGQVVNKELCYLFSLLRNVEISEICGYLDISLEREWVIYDLDTGYILDRFPLGDCKKASKMNQIEEKYASMPKAGIGFFSSGQYAKLMFLAKLYWFLEGYHKDREYYASILGDNFFSLEEAMQEGESALIFIDEGELYYHPEWQRRFVAVLLEMLNQYVEEARLQVIFTTNSPFVISDMLMEDVQYLSDHKEQFGSTLGQNIHKLLTNNFFMEFTIGQYSREMIEAVIGLLNGEENTDSKKNIYRYFDEIQDESKIQEWKMVRYLIQQIGEPVYQKKLEKMLEKWEPSKEVQIQELERKKADLEAEIAKLKDGEYSKE